MSGPYEKALSYLKQNLKNLVRLEVIVSHKSAEGKSLATIDIDGEESEYFPVWQIANGFKKHWIPLRSGEQVLALFPFGNTSKGYLLRSGFSSNAKEPSGADANTEIIEYADGTRISYNASSSELSINCIGDVTINAQGAITFNAPSFTFNGDLKVDGSTTNTGDITAGGVITDSDGNNGA